MIKEELRRKCEKYNGETNSFASFIPGSVLTESVNLYGLLLAGARKRWSPMLICALSPCSYMEQRCHKQLQHKMCVHFD